MKLIFTVMTSMLLSVAAYAIDLDRYEIIDIPSKTFPSILSDKYYSDMDGETGEFINGRYHSLYTLSDSILMNIEGELAIGYYKGYPISESREYYICDIRNCNNEDSRIPVPEIGWYGAGGSPLVRTTIGMFSGYGNIMIPGRKSTDDESFTSVIINTSGDILNTLETPAGLSGSAGTTKYFMGTTRVTNEENFVFLSASNNEFIISYQQFDKEKNRLDTFSLVTNQDIALDIEYPNGLLPVSISDPRLEGGKKYYKVVLAKLDMDLNIEALIWGDVNLNNGKVKFKEELKSGSLTTPHTPQSGAAVTYMPIFHEDNTFTWWNYKLDFNKDNFGGVLDTNYIVSPEGEYMNTIYKKTSSGKIVVFEKGSGYKVLKPTDSICF